MKLTIIRRPGKRLLDRLRISRAAQEAIAAADEGETVEVPSKDAEALTGCLCVEVEVEASDSVAKAKKRTDGTGQGQK